MNLRTLTRRSLRYHFRSQLGVLAGVTLAAAVLIGALAVGDSVKGSLRERALERLAGARFALSTPDRFHPADLADRLAAPRSSTLLALAGMAARQDGTARANRVTVLGVDPARFGDGRLASLKEDEVWLNSSLAQQLQATVGDFVILRLNKPSALSRDAVITPRDDLSVALRLRLAGVLADRQGGGLSLLANQAPSLNAFVSRSLLGKAVGLEGLANLILVPPDGERPGGGLELLRDQLAQVSDLADFELNLRTNSQSTELTTRRIFLESAVVRAALALAPSTAARRQSEATPILTYLVNSLTHGDQLTPYSLVTAAGAPYTPADLADDEIVVNQWLAADLGVKPGDSVALTYYRVDAGTQLQEFTNRFRVHSIVPLAGLHADRTLMPEFPGLSKAESTRDWDAGFDLVHPIRDQDEAYWKQHRGTPKAFITLAAGQKLWANRFGELTAIRWFGGNPSSPRPAPGVAGESTSPLSVPELRDTITARIRAHLDPADVGLVWRPVREEALRAAESGTGQEFGGLMLGFSFFLITAALLLTAMLFSFALEQRATEIGILLALGWPPRRVHNLLLREGLALAVLGSVLGSVLGICYAQGVLWGLTTIWRDAIAGAGLEFHLTLTTLGTGLALSIAVAAGTMFLALRQQARRPARELLNEGANESALSVPEGNRGRPRLAALGASVLASGLVVGAGLTPEINPQMFFGAGAALLLAGLLWVRVWLRPAVVPAVRRRASQPSYLGLALRALARRPSRSLGTVALLASAAFLIVAVAANKLDATRHAEQRGSGTGGFALWGESTLPVIQDLNTAKGQEFYGLNPDDLKGVSFVQFRVRDGDDASCLNLNRAQRPRLLGVKPEQLADRGAFTFTRFAAGVAVTNGWQALNQPGSDDGAIPAIGDAASIQWALKSSVGGTLDSVDERGRPFKIRLVGAVANSILQGNLLIAERDFVRLFPSESGYRGFLIEVAAQGAGQPASPPNPAAHVVGAEAVSATLSRALQDVGLELTPTVRRLDQFNAVQNTYLNTFQLLGGLGLLLGSAGLGVVVLRNVHERRGELGLMLALGFERGALKRLVLLEHGALLLLGLLVGGVAALVAVLPALGSPGAEFPWRSLTLTLGLVLANGLVWTLWATTRSLRGRLVDSLRDL
jgi:ABC-type antimicrobial peptide transport system permease subunit